MTIECGYAVRREPEGKPVVFHGEIDFGSISGEFFLIPHAAMRKENSPTHQLKLKNPRGDFEVVGNAWKKKLAAGGFMFSMTIDHPFLTPDKPVYLAVFPDDEQPKEAPKGEPANFTVKWSRPRRQSGGSGFAPEASGQDAPGLSDSIPY